MEVDIIEGNKLIAEFMGLTHLHSQTRTETLKYHDSWDWLMQVVEKCLIGEAECKEKELITNIYNGLTNINIFNTWLAVIEFIKWYNQNKKNNG